MTTLAVSIGLLALGSVGCGRGGAVPRSEPTAVGPFVCGQHLDLGDASDTRAGLTLKINASLVGPERGPTLTAEFTSTQQTYVNATRPTLFEVLYLRDGVIVGGGPSLNRPGDYSPAYFPLPHDGFKISPDQPVTISLGPRDDLCPSLTWPALWSAPASVDVVLVMGQVEGTASTLNVGALLPGKPLLVARTGLSTAAAPMIGS